jgi:hypothetical protein
VRTRISTFESSGNEAARTLFRILRVRLTAESGCAVVAASADLGEITAQAARCSVRMVDDRPSRPRTVEDEIAECELKAIVQTNVNDRNNNRAFSPIQT